MFREGKPSRQGQRQVNFGSDCNGCTFLSGFVAMIWRSQGNRLLERCLETMGQGVETPTVLPHMSALQLAGSLCLSGTRWPSLANLLIIRPFTGGTMSREPFGVLMSALRSLTKPFGV